MSTVAVPPNLESPRDDASHLHKAFKGTVLFPCIFTLHFCFSCIIDMCISHARNVCVLFSLMVSQDLGATLQL